MVRGVLITLFVLIAISVFTIGFIYLLVLLRRLLKTFQKSVNIRERELNYLEKKDKEANETIVDTSK